jgi:hypothetical protein
VPSPGPLKNPVSLPHPPPRFAQGGAADPVVMFGKPRGRGLKKKNAKSPESHKKRSH